jgi:hypothetical protein
VNHYRAKIAGYQSELRTGNLKPSKRQELERAERYYAEQVVAIYGRLLGHEKPKLQAITLIGDPKNPLHMTHDLQSYRMVNSMPSPASSPSLADRLRRMPLTVTSLEVREEQRRRREVRETEAIERDYAKLRRQQTGRGGLLNFVRYFWHTLEPKTRPMIVGWVVEAICLHLEAITFGDIPSNRLLINVPPGFMKSLLVNVFWPAWEWGPPAPHALHLVQLLR